MPLGEVVSAASSEGISRAHRLALGTILGLQLLSPLLPSLYYQLLQRPALIDRGALPCGVYKRVIADEGPDTCDLAIASRSGDEVDEVYYGKHGGLTTLVRSREGNWRSSEETNHSVDFALPFPVVALALGAIVILHKVARTKAFLSWQLARHPYDRFERLLLFYAVPVFLLGFLMMPLTSYLWLAIG